MKTVCLPLAFVYWQTPQEAVLEDFKVPLDLSYGLSSRSQWPSSFLSLISFVFFVIFPKFSNFCTGHANHLNYKDPFLSLCIRLDDQTFNLVLLTKVISPSLDHHSLFLWNIFIENEKYSILHGIHLLFLVFQNISAYMSGKMYQHCCWISFGMFLEHNWNFLFAGFTSKRVDTLELVIICS